MLDFHRFGRQHFGMDDDSRGTQRKRQAKLVAGDTMAGNWQETGVFAPRRATVACRIDRHVFHQRYKRDPQNNAS